MSSDFLSDRRKSLEEKFFHQREQRLLEQLRREHEHEEARGALAAVTGIENTAVLDDLIRTGIRVETLVAMSMVPLVFVAWSDRQMAPEEKKAILEAAESSGIKPGEASYQMLESWLESRPGDDLLEAWEEYVRGLRTSLGERSYTQIRNDIVQRARDVAKAAGGYFEMAKVSRVEKQMLARIEAAFTS